MIGLNWGGAVSSIEKALRKHAPSILAGLGIAGMLSATVQGIRATPEALRRIEQRKEEKNVEKLGIKETIEVAGPCYIPTVVTTIASVGCMIGSTSVSNRRSAAISAAYSLSETALRTYQDKVVETIGERKEQQIREKAAAEYVKKADISPNTIILTGKGDVLCMDTISQRPFMSSISAIEKAQNTFNFNLRQEMYMSLNDFYDILNIPHFDGVGDDIGWSVDKYEMAIHFSSTLHGNEAVIVADFSYAPPRHDYKL